MPKETQELSGKLLDILQKAPGWGKAISEAEFEIGKAQNRIRELRKAVKFFRDREKAGDPYPRKVA